jgi:hypothetical protein
VAKTKIAAAEQKAIAEIKKWEAETLTALAVGALETDSARSFFENLPALERLMPPLTMASLEAAETAWAAAPGQ